MASGNGMWRSTDDGERVMVALTSEAIRGALQDAAGHLVALAGSIPADGWSRPALGEWTVRDLTGHAVRALITIEQYLANATPTRPAVQSPVDYFVKALALADRRALDASVAQRGREAGAALGERPVNEVRAIVARVLSTTYATPDDTVLPTVAGSMRLIDYLPTRVFELTIHGLDITAALGRSDQPPRSALAVTLDLASGLAIERSAAGELLLAITGRRQLPVGYSIL